MEPSLFFAKSSYVEKCILDTCFGANCIILNLDIKIRDISYCYCTAMHSCPHIFSWKPVFLPNWTDYCEWGYRECAFGGILCHSVNRLLCCVYFFENKLYYLLLTMGKCVVKIRFIHSAWLNVPSKYLTRKVSHHNMGRCGPFTQHDWKVPSKYLTWWI